MCGARSIGAPRQVTVTPPALPMISESGNSPLTSRTVPGGCVPVTSTAPDPSRTSIQESAGKRITRGLSGTPGPLAPPVARDIATGAGAVAALPGAAELPAEVCAGGSVVWLPGNDWGEVDGVDADIAADGVPAAEAAAPGPGDAGAGRVTNGDGAALLVAGDGTTPAMLPRAVVVDAVAPGGEAGAADRGPAADDADG